MRIALLSIEPVGTVPYLQITIGTCEKAVMGGWDRPFLGETKEKIDGKS